MIRFREFIQEVFGGSDKGYPYKKDDSGFITSPIKRYNIDLPDHVHDAKVGIHHYKEGEGHYSAEVDFTMPTRGYGIKPDEKETYKNAFKHHRQSDMDGYSDEYGIEAVRKKHGSEAAQRVSKSVNSDQSFRNYKNGTRHVYRIMSTVKKIMDEHGRNNPEIKHFEFTSSGQAGDSRDRLYHALTIKHGGHRDDMDRYVIPNPHYNGTIIKPREDLDEVFGGRDKGFPYKFNNGESGGGLHVYNVDLPDHVKHAHVVFDHFSNEAHVGFDMPNKYYGLVSPEVKETYKSALRDHGGNITDALNTVKEKHGDNAAAKTELAVRGSARTWRQNPYTAHHAYRMMSTVKKVMDEHGRNHPYIKHFTFEAMSDTDSRKKLYDAINRHHGGSKTPEGHYTIPNPHYDGSRPPKETDI